MKIKLILLAFALTVARLSADILAADTAVFLQPDAKSHVLSRLKAGNTIIYTGDAPAGWRRVELTGTFEAYVHSRDISKGLEVKEGASVYAAPRKDAPVLTVANKGDKTEITGLRGDYCQVKLEKKLQGFVAIGATANTPSDTKGLYSVTAPVPPPAPGSVTTAGHPVQLSGNTADMPRMFAGRLVLARRPIINPNPLYDYQLVDVSGRRFAYVDTRRLLLTDKIEAYLDRDISITGTVRNTVDGKDLVIAAESMQLK